MHAVIAVIRSVCPFPYWGKGVVVEFDPTGVWACACASVGLDYIGATSALGKTPPISGLGNIIFNNASAAGSCTPETVRKSCFLYILYTNIALIIYEKGIHYHLCSAGYKNTDLIAGVQVFTTHR